MSSGVRRGDSGQVMTEFSASTIRSRLRDGTHAEHVRLNQHPLLKGITRPGYTLSMYRRVLVAYYHFYGALEVAIERSDYWVADAFSYEPRRKLGWIVQDLVALGVDPDEPGWLPSSPIFPPLAGGLAPLVGVLYTIEGSTLGGQVISRHIGTHLGLAAANGGRFFFGYGPETPNYWAEFEAFMEASLASSEQFAQALGAARDTFMLMEKILDDYATRRFR